MANNLTDETLEQEIANGVTLVDFWAPWCGPCKTLGPIIDKVAEEVPEGAKVAKVNVDENGEASMKYGIRAIPTMLIFKNGEVVGRLVGMKGKAEILEAITSHLN